MEDSAVTEAAGEAAVVEASAAAEAALAEAVEDSNRPTLFI